MAVIKVACPKCGQKVSGDETFYGRSVHCPICEAKIVFPESPKSSKSVEEEFPAAEPAVEKVEEETKVVPSFDELPPQASRTEVASTSAAASAAVAQSNFEADSLDEDESAPSPILGIMSLVAGVLNLLGMCLPGIILAPVAIILGHMGLSRANNSPVQPAPGKTPALIGTILGYVGILGTIILLVSALLSKDQIIEAIQAAEPQQQQQQ